MKKILLIMIVVLITVNGYSQLKVLNNGNIGVGTLSPAEKLEVRSGNLLVNDSKDFILKANGTDPNPGDVVFKNSSNVEYGRLFAFSDALRIRANASIGGDINILNSNGYVGIGYTYPAYKLDVAGYIRGYNLTPSDARLKENVKNMTGALSSITKLQGVTYKLKSSAKESKSGFALMSQPKVDTVVISSKSVTGDTLLYNRNHMGFLAQELQKVYPELVFEDKDGLLSVDYISLIPVLVESIKELNTRTSQNTQLQADLQQLQLKFSDLEARITQCCGSTKTKTKSASILKEEENLGNTPNT